jgi:cbb3-type cytochrome oxidase maturation protein
MSVIFLLIPLSILIAAGFLAAFVWAVRSGQFEDTCTPSLRLLMDDPAPKQRGEQSISAHDKIQP